jgi:hypothetical protein
VAPFSARTWAAATASSISWRPVGASGPKQGADLTLDGVDRDAVPAGDLAVGEAGGDFGEPRLQTRRQASTASDAPERLLNQRVLWHVAHPYAEHSAFHTPSAESVVVEFSRTYRQGAMVHRQGKATVCAALLLGARLPPSLRVSFGVVLVRQGVLFERSRASWNACQRFSSTRWPQR